VLGYQEVDMKQLPAITDRQEFDPVIIRTDYSDERAWQEVVAALMASRPGPLGDGTIEPSVHIVDDPAWAEAGVDEVLAAVSTDECLTVVFLADQKAMQSHHHGLLAVSVVTRERLEDDKAYEAMIAFGREFRTVPAGVHEIHANLEIANMDFDEFAEAAHSDPEGVYRAF
jgi:hypothetical protein